LIITVQNIICFASKFVFCCQLFPRTLYEDNNFQVLFLTILLLIYCTCTMFLILCCCVQWLQSTRKPNSFSRCTIPSRTRRFILKKR